MTKKELDKAIDMICAKAVLEMGESWKGLSWFASSDRKIRINSERTAA